MFAEWKVPSPVHLHTLPTLPVFMCCSSLTFSKKCRDHFSSPAVRSRDNGSNAIIRFYICVCTWQWNRWQSSESLSGGHTLSASHSKEFDVSLAVTIRCLRIISAIRFKLLMIMEQYKTRSRTNHPLVHYELLGSPADKRNSSTSSWFSDTATNTAPRTSSSK